jgi:hypothetical protein
MLVWIERHWKEISAAGAAASAATGWLGRSRIPQYWRTYCHWRAQQADCSTCRRHLRQTRAELVTMTQERDLARANAAYQTGAMAQLIDSSERIDRLKDQGRLIPASDEWSTRPSHSPSPLPILRPKSKRSTTKTRSGSPPTGTGDDA